MPICWRASPTRTVTADDLYVGTADLDARRFVVWNMGLIATHGTSGSLRAVPAASCSRRPRSRWPFRRCSSRSRPAAGCTTTMHVDGGVGARVFVNGGVLRADAFRERGGLGVGREDIYVIHNGQLIPPPEPVRRSLPSIAIRVLDATGRAAVLGDLLRIHAHAQRGGTRASRGSRSRTT